MTESRFHKDFLSLSDSLYKIAYYMLESQSEAEDAVEELFLKLWKAKDELDRVKLPKAYCIRILKNICFDRMRKAQHLSFPEILPEIDYTPALDDKLDAKARLDKVLEAVKALPERQRQVLMLRTMEELSYEQIAERVGINQLSCRVLLSQARHKIKSLV